jgi:hypothetical protein
VRHRRTSLTDRTAAGKLGYSTLFVASSASRACSRRIALMAAGKPAYGATG